MIISAYMQTKCTCLCIYAYLYHTDVLRQEWPYLVVCTVVYCKQQLTYKGTESRQQTPSHVTDLTYQELKDGFCFHFRKTKTHCSRGSQKTKLLQAQYSFPFFWILLLTLQPLAKSTSSENYLSNSIFFFQGIIWTQKQAAESMPSAKRPSRSLVSSWLTFCPSSE